MSFRVDILNPQEWATFSEDAHKVVFKEERPRSLDRIDMALLGLRDKQIVAYATVRELDSESCYLQYGGSIPDTLSGHAVYRVYGLFLETLAGVYKRVSTLVSNQNLRYLKLAMAKGFRIIGTRFFKGEIFVELLLEFGHAVPE